MFQLYSTENKNFWIDHANEGATLSLSLVSEERCVSVYRLDVSFPSPVAVSPITLRWNEPMLGCLSSWNPAIRRNRGLTQWAAPLTNTSNFYKGAPIIALVNHGSVNYTTVSLSESEYDVKLQSSVNDFEEKENMLLSCILFKGGELIKDYTLFIRIDNDRNKPFYESIPQACRWWNEFYPNTNPPTVNGELPLYSSWYNYHQHPESSTMEKELEIAAKMGFGSVIIDDGWSYDGLGTGDYFDCGNWKVATSKFPDFKGFIEKAHALHLKVALWFPVPFIGYNNPDFEKFRDKMYYLTDEFRTGILDPRYPAVRKYVIDSYKSIVDAYDLDGLKLDFIDFFQLYGDVTAYKDCGGAAGKDCEGMEEGVIKLLEEIKGTFTQKDPDFMFEFRQPYFSPSIARFCNMLRVGDCPFDLIKNRMGVIDLRLFDYNVAVHADMLYWAFAESTENCAIQLYNVLFGVPQISVLLAKINDEQFALIQKYLDYWKANREIILHGVFKAYNPEFNYTLASAENDCKRIAVSYLNDYYKFDGKPTDLFNATEKTEYCIENASDTAAQITLFDCLGRVTGKLTVDAGQIKKVSVKKAGMMSTQ